MDDPKEDNKEEDKVAAAYENISKKLESIRSGKTPEDDDIEVENEDEPKKDIDGLKEWKGPKGVKSEEEAEEEGMELRKVKLKNLENSDKTEDELEKESEDSDDQDEIEEDAKDDKESDRGLDKETQDDAKTEEKWKPSEDDPLDEEPSDAKAMDDKDGSDDTGLSETPGRSESSERQHQPDTLDDLTEESASATSAKASDDAEAMSDKSDDEEDDYDIPNLKGSRQRPGNIGYNNTPLQTETFARSYQDKSSMESNDPNNFFSQHNQNPPVKRANKFHLLILVSIGIAVIGFTVYILKGGFGGISITSQPSPSPSPVESPSPTPTPTPEPDRAKYKVRVLNGSGKTGLAKTVSEKLKGLGYQIEKTGNATNSAFIQTIIKVKTADEPFIPQIVKDLAPDFEAAGNTSLKDDDTVNIEIILGAK